MINLVGRAGGGRTTSPHLVQMRGGSFDSDSGVNDKL